MNALTELAKPPSGRARRSPPAEQALIAPKRLQPSMPEQIPLGELRRAPENVRHHDAAEAVEALQADIAAKGLLQSLIGYQTKIPGRAAPVTWIVGGGRRLSALRGLEEDGIVDDDWPVPVLIRRAEEALELSLSENLQQRTMSPVDEFFAFAKLMETGRWDAPTLAARFGFKEKHVRQRLRLAELAPEILTALSERKISLDAAMAYASASDRDLQRQVWRQHVKPSFFEAHRPDRIRRDLRAAGRDTSDRLYKFVGAAAYEAAGGGYEDDLFTGEPRPGFDAGVRQLSHAHLIEQLAHEAIDRQAAAFIRTLRARADLAPTVAGLVRIPGLILHTHGTDAKLTPPVGFVEVRRWEWKGVWATIRNNGLPAHVAVGVDAEGRLALCPGLVFVEKHQREAVDPRAAAVERTREAFAGMQLRTPAAGPIARPPAVAPPGSADPDRERSIELRARRLAVPTVKGTAFEGRLFIAEGQADRAQHAGQDGWMLTAGVFVTDEDVAAQRAAAAAEIDAEDGR